MKTAYYFTLTYNKKHRQAETEIYDELMYLLQRHLPQAEHLGEKPEFEQLYDLWVLLRRGQIRVKRLLTEPREVIFLEVKTGKGKLKPGKGLAKLWV